MSQLSFRKLHTIGTEKIQTQQMITGQVFHSLFADITDGFGRSGMIILCVHMHV